MPGSTGQQNDWVYGEAETFLGTRLFHALCLTAT